MDSHIKEYFRQFSDELPRGNFHKVIALHEQPQIEWPAIQKLIPQMFKGWFELSHLSPRDRIEFIRDFWFQKIPYRTTMTKPLNSFFNSMDDIGVFITQKLFDDPYEVQLVYSLKGDSGYYHGLPPATDEEIRGLQKLFPEYIFPPDYLAFMQIHSGFSKGTDTGIFPLSKIGSCYKQFQQLLYSEDIITTQSGEAVDPQTLIPFYESFGMPYFQCFWASWYPEEEMGNVYYSGLTKKIPDVKSGSTGGETMAFTTFTDWLMFYLELIDK